MKLFKKMRKGFTLIELVVVIAVIAILSAVAVVSYISITNRAKQSNDQQKINQVNLSLAANEISGKPKTMYEAMKAVDEDGFGPDRFKAESKDYTFAYKMSENRFVILEKGKVVYPKDIKTPDPVDLWLFSDKGGNLKDGYSHYLRGDIKEAVEVSGGLDVGNNTGVPSVLYSSSKGQSVVIRTDGGTLTVDAPLDTVKHYNKADLVDIKQVASNSYHEYGEVPLAKIANGRIVISPEAKLDGIHAVATGEGSEAYFNNIAIGVVGNAEVPEITRDRVAVDDVEAEGTYSQYVLEVQSLANEKTNPSSENTDYVWVNVSIEGSAKTENTVVSDTAATSETAKMNSGENVQVQASANPSEAAANVVSNTETAEYVSTFKELKDALEEAKKYIVFKNDIAANDAATIDYDVTIDGAGHKLTTSEYRASDARSINVGWDNANVNATLRDLTVVGPRGDYSRGLNIANSHVTLNVYNCSISAGSYAINVTGSGNNLKLNIHSSTINGWSAFNIWGFYNEINAQNSTLIGTNDKGYNADGWNDFGTICFEADTTKQTSGTSYNNKVILTGCTVKAVVETNGNLEYLVLFNYNSPQSAYGHYVEFNNCKCEFDKDHKYLFNDAPNTIVEDGVVVTQ